MKKRKNLNGYQQEARRFAVRAVLKEFPHLLQKEVAEIFDLSEQHIINIINESDILPVIK